MSINTFPKLLCCAKNKGGQVSLDIWCSSLFFFFIFIPTKVKTRVRVTRKYLCFLSIAYYYIYYRIIIICDFSRLVLHKDQYGVAK